MDALSSSDVSLSALYIFCCSLDFAERKALITLARSQCVPDPMKSPILFSRVSIILDKMTFCPPFSHDAITPFNRTGEIIATLVASPITSGLVISYALGVELSSDDVANGSLVSFSKELKATQTVRRSSSWNWDAILVGDMSSAVSPSLAPKLSKLQLSIRKPLSLFRTRMNNRTILPHYTRRGVSSETASLLSSKVRKRGFLHVHGPASTLHAQFSHKDVTSLDIVHHYIRTGEWIRGRTEMKQRWYPSQLLPRTYFSWGGIDISISSYLRSFFNDLADQFQSTQRKNRVQPDWLFDPTLSPEGSFCFYDLTSFTSWFHEHVPFLQAVARYFSGTTVFLLGYGLSLKEQDLGSLVDCYIRWCNDFPEFIVSSKLLSREVSDTMTFSHQCAGFLGIPGNLASCTLPHGLALASRFSDTHQLQVPGDDVGFSFKDVDDKHDTFRIASSLGVFQPEKAYSLPQDSIYLKRAVVDLGTSIQLADMLLYPLLPALIPRTLRDMEKSSVYRLPSGKDIVKRTCIVLTAFLRDLWNITKGVLSDSHQATILSFVRGIHKLVGIPLGAIFQGELYGDDGFEPLESILGVTIKFPVDEDDCLQNDPDRTFASRYVEHMVIRYTTDVEVTELTDELLPGQTINVPKRKGWTFLEDMGYVKIRGIPGQAVHLIGVEAKTAFLAAVEPNLREIVVLHPLGREDLMAVGILTSEDNEGELHAGFGEVIRSVESEQSWRYSKYIDLDEPKQSTGYGSVPLRGVDSFVSSRLDSVSFEDIFLDY